MRGNVKPVVLNVEDLMSEWLSGLIQQLYPPFEFIFVGMRHQLRRKSSGQSHVGVLFQGTSSVCENTRFPSSVAYTFRSI